MSWWVYILVGGVGYLFFVLSYLPASHAISWFLPDDLPLVTTDVEGTVWQGNAGHVFYEDVELGSVNWSFKPLVLLVGQLGYEITLSDDSKQIDGDAAFNPITGTFIISDTKGTIHAAKIPSLIGQPYLQLTGDLEMDIQHIELFDQWPSSADGLLLWHNASISKPIETQLGELQIELSDDETLIKTQIKDISGPLKIDTMVELQADRSYRIKGKIKETGTANQSLIGLLRNVGRQHADGSVQIDYSGQL